MLRSAPILQKSELEIGLLFYKTFLHEENRSFFIKRKTERKKGQKVRKIEMAEAESHTCGKSSIPASGVRRFDLADWSGKLHRTTPVSSFLLLILFFFRAC